MDNFRNGTALWLFHFNGRNCLHKLIQLTDRSRFWRDLLFLESIKALLMNNRGKGKESTKGYTSSQDQPDMALLQALDMAIQSHMEGNLEEARRIYKRILKHHPRNTNVLNNLAILFKDMGKLDEAVKYFKKAIMAEPDIAETYNNLGFVLLEKGELEEAAECFKKALDREPGMTYALNNLANTLKKMGKGHEAINLFKERLEAEPDSADLHNSLGVMLKEEGEVDEAISEYKKALELNPKLAEAHNNLAVAYKETGRLEDAVKQFRKALEINPKAAQIHNNLGNTYEEMGELTKAISLYQNAIELDPKLVDAYNNLGLLLEHSGQMDDAILCFRQALYIDPDLAEVHNNLGTALEHRGEIEEAIECFKRAIELNPSLSSARHMLHALKGETPEAPPEEYVKELFDRYSNRFDNHLVKGLEYKVPSLLKATFVKVCGQPARFSKAVDLGCGTGLFGMEIREMVDHLCGIDISSKMIEIAKQKNIYDQLWTGDIVEILGKIDFKFDLIVAADVFVYIGRLDPIFEVVQKCSTDNAIFGFSAEICQHKDYELLNTGRYAHSFAYIETLAKRFGFEMLDSSCENLRKEKGVWIKGNIYLLRKISES